MLRFLTRFVLFDPIRNPDHICTGDCGGAGSVEFDIGSLERGMYAIWIGDKQVGELYLPFDFSYPDTICFSSRTYRSAVPTRTATPPPNQSYPMPPSPY